MFEPESPLPEIDLSGDTSINHPLECPVDRGTTDLVILGADQFDQVIGAEVPLLAKEDVDDKLTFRRAPAPGQSETFKVIRLRFHLWSPARLEGREPSSVRRDEPPQAASRTTRLPVVTRRTTARSRTSSSRWGS